jgi:hypothetical protein
MIPQFQELMLPIMKLAKAPNDHNNERQLASPQRCAIALNRECGKSNEGDGGNQDWLSALCAVGIASGSR